MPDAKGIQKKIDDLIDGSISFGLNVVLTFLLVLRNPLQNAKYLYNKHQPTLPAEQLQSLRSDSAYIKATTLLFVSSLFLPRETGGVLTIFITSSGAMKADGSFI